MKNSKISTVMLSEKFTRMDDETRYKITDICEHTYKKCRPYFKNTRVALDIGSKRGLFARHMCKDFDHVHMFDMRKKMHWENVDSKKVTLHLCAIGNKIGEVKHAGALTNVKVEGVDTIVSQLRTVDSFNFDVVDFIKIDVEGDEQVVLEGAVNTLDIHRPVIVLEQNESTELYNKGKYGDAVRWLQEHNYKITNYDGWDDWIMTHVEDVING